MSTTIRSYDIRNNKTNRVYLKVTGEGWELLKEKKLDKHFTIVRETTLAGPLVATFIPEEISDAAKAAASVLKKQTAPAGDD